MWCKRWAAFKYKVGDSRKLHLFLLLLRHVLHWRWVILGGFLLRTHAVRTQCNSAAMQCHFLPFLRLRQQARKAKEEDKPYYKHPKDLFLSNSSMQKVCIACALHQKTPARRPNSPKIICLEVP